MKESVELFDDSGFFLGKIPADCVADCTHSGQCDTDIARWLKRLNFTVPRDLAIKYLREWGAWETLDTDNDEVLASRVLWLACGSIRDGDEWLGLVH